MRIKKHLKKHHHHWVGFILACIAIALIVNIAIAAPAIPVVWASLTVLNWQFICSAAVALAALGAYAGYRAFGQGGTNKWTYFALTSLALMLVLPIFFLAAPSAYFGFCHFLGFHLAETTLASVAIKAGYCMAGLFGLGLGSNAVMATSLTQSPWANACVKLMACAFLAGVGVSIISPLAGVILVVVAPMLAYMVGRISVAVGGDDPSEYLSAKPGQKKVSVTPHSGGNLRQVLDEQKKDPLQPATESDPGHNAATVYNAL